MQLLISDTPSDQLTAGSFDDVLSDIWTEEEASLIAAVAQPKKPDRGVLNFSRDRGHCCLIVQPSDGVLSLETATEVAIPESRMIPVKFGEVGIAFNPAPIKRRLHALRRILKGECSSRSIAQLAAAALKGVTLNKGGNSYQY